MKYERSKTPIFKLHTALDAFKARRDTDIGDAVEVFTDELIDLIEERNAMYEALKFAVENGIIEQGNYINNLANAALAKAEGRS